MKWLIFLILISSVFAYSLEYSQGDTIDLNGDSLVIYRVTSNKILFEINSKPYVLGLNSEMMFENFKIKVHSISDGKAVLSVDEVKNTVVVKEDNTLRNFSISLFVVLLSIIVYLYIKKRNNFYY